MRKKLLSLVFALLLCAIPPLAGPHAFLGYAKSAAPPRAPTVPNKRHSTCEQECQSYCHVGSSGAIRQFVCQNKCFVKCRSHRSEER
jgi:hypothetical protein